MNINLKSALTITNLSIFAYAFGFLNLVLYCLQKNVPFPVGNFLYLDIIISSIFLFMVIIFISPLLVTQAMISSSTQIKSTPAKYAYGIIFSLLLIIFYYVYYSYIFANLQEIYSFGGIPPYEKLLYYFNENYMPYLFWSTFTCEVFFIILVILNHFSKNISSILDFAKPFSFVFLSIFVIFYTISPLPSDIAGFSLRTIRYGDFLRVVNNGNFISYVVKRSSQKNINVSSLFVEFIIREDHGYFCKIFAEVSVDNKLVKTPIGYYFIPLNLMHKWNILV